MLLGLSLVIFTESAHLAKRREKIEEKICLQKCHYIKVIECKIQIHFYLPGKNFSQVEAHIGPEKAARGTVFWLKMISDGSSRPTWTAVNGRFENSLRVFLGLVLVMVTDLQKICKFLPPKILRCFSHLLQR